MKSSWGWLGAALLTASAGVSVLRDGLGWTGADALLAWQPDTAWTQPWRWWTAALLHWGPWHFAANLGGGLAVIAWGLAARLPVSATWAWLVAWPLSQALLVTDPAPPSAYAGLSGVLHAGVAIGCWHLCVHETGMRRAIGAAVATAVALKLGLEVPLLQSWLQGIPASTVPASPLPGVEGVRLAGHAHACGTAAGVLMAALASAVASCRPSRI